MNEHSGGINGGHYYVHINFQGKWYCVNDSKVSEDDKYKSEDSLVLFYKRKSYFVD